MNPPPELASRLRHGAEVIATVAALLAVSAAAAGAAAEAGADPYRPSQWGLERIGAPTAWAEDRGGGQVIAIVDTGVDLTHPDLVDRLLRDAAGEVVGRDYIDDDEVAQDENGHGTMVAGIAAATADNGVGIAGVAPEARIMPVRVLDAEGQGTSRDVDAGIRWAVDRGATVINLSLESVSLLPGALVATAPVEAVRYAWDEGVVVVAAAGNSGEGFTDYPASSPVLLVGATDREDRRAMFSDSGRRDGVLAPGVEIVSTWCDPTPEGCRPDHRYGQADGTSFASPAVAAAVAVLRGAGLGPEASLTLLRETAEDLGPEGPDPDNGHGRIDLARAAAALPRPETSSSQTPTPVSPRPSPPAREGTDGATSRPPTSPAPRTGTDPRDTAPDDGTTGAQPGAGGGGAEPAPSGTTGRTPPSTTPAPGPGDDIGPVASAPPAAAGGRSGTGGPPRDLVLSLAVVLFGLSVSAQLGAWRGRHGR